MGGMLICCGCEHEDAGKCGEAAGTPACLCDCHKAVEAEMIPVAELAKLRERLAKADKWVEEVAAAANKAFKLDGCCHWETVCESLDRFVAERDRALAAIDGKDLREGHIRDNSTPDELRDLLLGAGLEIARLKAELDLWRPLTPEEAEKAVAQAQAAPMSDERIAEIVAFATDPAESLNNDEWVQLAAKNRQLRAEIVRLAGRVAGLEREQERLRVENERLRERVGVLAARPGAGG